MDQKILAIDFGTKRIGLALSHGTLATPLEIIANDSEAIAAIKKICETEMVTQIVMGLSENEMAEKTKEFAQRVEKATALPIHFMDETLSSHTVGGKLKASGASLARRQQPIDDLAAAEFLQEYLDSTF